MARKPPLSGRRLRPAPDDLADAKVTRARNYEVGYGRPPKHSQFKPGQSGNPKGRAPKTRNLKTLVDQILEEQIVMHIGGKKASMSHKEAAVRSALLRTIKGEASAFSGFLALLKFIGYRGKDVDELKDALDGFNPEAVIADYERKKRKTPPDEEA